MNSKKTKRQKVLEKSIGHIVIKMPSYIGDSVNTTPAIEILRQEYPHAHFTILCRPHIADLFRNREEIDEVILDNTKEAGTNRVLATLGLIKILRKNHYQLGVLFHNSFLSALVFRLSRIDIVVGYAKECRVPLLDFWLPIDRTRHRINHYAHLINASLDYRYEKLPPVRLVPSKTDLVRFANGRLTVGLHVGNETKFPRNYPRGHTVSLLRTLVDRYNVVVLGDEKDLNYLGDCGLALWESRGELLNLCGQLTVGELIDVIHDLDFLITIDSGPLHIASATGTPFVALVGKGTSAWDTVAPKTELGIVLKRGKGYIEDHKLIESITPKDVVDALEKLSKEQTSRGVPAVSKA